MKRHISYIIVVTTFLGACTSMYGSPEQRRLNNMSRSDYYLCEKLAMAALAPDEVRSEWAAELQRRGADCGRYAGAISNAMAQSQNAMNVGLKMMQPTAVAPVGASSGTGGVTCFAKREWTSGFNKNCAYDCLGSEAVQTIPSTSPCPQTIVR